VARWYEEGYDQMPQEAREKHWLFFLRYRSLLEKAANPIAAIRAYLDQRETPEKTD